MENVIDNISRGKRRYNPYENLITTILQHFHDPLVDGIYIQHHYGSVFDTKIIKAMEIYATLDETYVESPVY